MPQSMGPSPIKGPKAGASLLDQWHGAKIHRNLSVPQLVRVARIKLPPFLLVKILRKNTRVPSASACAQK